MDDLTSDIKALNTTNLNAIEQPDDEELGKAEASLQETKRQTCRNEAV